MVLVCDGGLERAVQRLGIFFLRVLRGTEVYKPEHLTGLQKALLVLAHQVLFHFDAGRHPPAVALDETEHVAEALYHKGIVLVAPVGQTYPALAHHVVGIVGVDVLAAFHAAWQIHVVHRDLRQGELAAVAVHVRHLLVVELRTSPAGLLDEQAIGGLVQDVADGALAQFLRLAVPVGEVIGVEDLPCLQIPHLQLAAHKGDIHLVYVAAVGLVGKHRNTQHNTLGLVVHLALVLVAELAADKALIAILPVLVHLLAETEGTCRQVMTELLAQSLNGRCHHVPVVLLAHQLAVITAAIVQPDAGVQHRGVHGILPGKPVGGLVAVLTGCPVHEIGDSSLVKFVVRQYPAAEQDGIAAGISFLDFFLIDGGKAVNSNQGIPPKPFA